uniref:Uncharacterized protein n=1 Tax=Cacopsylla melanoneura TaxID=428564 RepID=A0A8D8X6J7_9HEMI
MDQNMIPTLENQWATSHPMAAPVEQYMMMMVQNVGYAAIKKPMGSSKNVRTPVNLKNKPMSLEHRKFMDQESCRALNETNLDIEETKNLSHLVRKENIKERK